MFDETGLGIAYKKTNTNNDENEDNNNVNWEYLTWDDLGRYSTDPETYDFYIDNVCVDLPVVKPGENGQTNQSWVLPEGHPYRFSKYPKNIEYNKGEVAETPDLVAQHVTDVKKNQRVSVNLRHQMAAMTLRIAVNNEGFNLKPKSAWLKNVFEAAYSFQRCGGGPYLQYRDVGKTEQPELHFDTEEGPINTNWEKEEDYINNITYYQSELFLIPNQLNSPPRPVLTIEMEDGAKYSGMLPMYVTLDTGDGAYQSVEMNFQSGYRFDFEVLISNEPDILQFRNCKMVPWTHKGSMTLNGSQASIADEDNFNDLINLYKKACNDPDKNKDDKYGFYKWGYYDSQKKEWCFNLFQSLEFNEEDLAGKMPEDPALRYSFVMHYGLVIIKLPNGSEVRLSKEDKGEEKLKNLLNNGTLELD